MSDNFSIRDSLNRQAERESDAELPAESDDRLDDPGEAAWALDSAAPSGEADSPGADAIPPRASATHEMAAPELPALPPLPNFGDEEDEPAGPSSLDPVRLLYGVWARRNLVILVAGAVVILFGLLAFTMLHHSWTARVVLLKREHIDQFQVGRFGTPFKQQNYSLKTMLDTLKLPSVLAATIDKAGVDAIPRTLASQINVILGKESNIFQITVTWDDPRQAANLANILVETFVDRNRTMRREEAQQVFDYYSRQLDSSGRGLKTLDDSILAYQEEHGVINVDSQTEVTLVKLAELEIEHRTLMAEIGVLKETEQRLDQTLADMPELIVQSSYYRNPLTKKLGELEWELEQMRGRYTDQNPKVIDVRDQIDKLRELIETGRDASTPENTYAANPNRQALSLKRLQLQDDLRLRGGQADALAMSIELARERLNAMAVGQKEFLNMTAERDSVSGLLDNLRNRVEEAKVMMLNDQGDFNIVEHARMPEEPQSSGRKLVLIAGVILGGGFGLFVALLLEFFDSAVRTRKEVLGLTEAELVFEVQEVPDGEHVVIDVAHPGEPIATVYRRILNDLQARLSRGSLGSVAIVSVERGAGRSLAAVNLAQVFSLKESHCTLVDADLSPSAGARASALFELDPDRSGLLELLRGEAPFAEILVKTESTGVDVLPAGRVGGLHGDASMYLGNRKMHELVERLRGTGQVLYDLPPLLSHETAYEVTAAIGHAILVARSGQTRKKDLKLVAQRLQSSGVTLDAVLLIGVPAPLMQSPRQFQKSV